MHELGTPAPEPPTGGTATGPAVDRERPLAEGAAGRDERVRSSYAAVARDYAEQFANELDQLPFERWLLDRVGAAAGARPLVDAGCGPGHVTAHLAAAGADARGIDLSHEMVEQARARFPGVRYDVGDLARLIRPENADGWGAVLALVLAHPPRRLGTSRRRCRARPPAGARRRPGRGRTRRSRRSTTDIVVRARRRARRRPARPGGRLGRGDRCRAAGRRVVRPGADRGASGDDGPVVRDGPPAAPLTG